MKQKAPYIPLNCPQNRGLFSDLYLIARFTDPQNQGPTFPKVHFLKKSFWALLVTVMA